MTKKQTELSEELREAVFEAARAGAAEAYTQNTGYTLFLRSYQFLHDRRICNDLYLRVRNENRRYPNTNQ